MFPHPSERFRLYIDETGIQSMKSASNDPYLCLLGVIMRTREHDGIVTERLRSIKADLFGHSEDTPVILHRREMVRGDAPFDRLRAEPALAEEFQTRWAALIREAPYIVLAAAIDKHAHLEKYRVWQHDPYHYCLECLLERYVKWLSRNGFVGDVVIEARGMKPDKRLKKSYRDFYKSGNDNASKTVVQSRLASGELKFALKSEDIAALQIADSLAHPTLAYMKAKKSGTVRADNYGQKLVSILIEHKYARHPKKRTIEGWGLKMLP